ncbi:hypothetical protein ACQP3J_26470 [Escherichia coli]
MKKNIQGRVIGMSVKRFLLSIRVERLSLLHFNWEYREAKHSGKFQQELTGLKDLVEMLSQEIRNFAGFLRSEKCSFVCESNNHGSA